MALIKCPSCDREISDKAEKCIYCGYVINKKIVGEKKCSECGAIITDEMDVCPNCGCPIEKEKIREPQKVEVTNVKLSVDKKKTKIILGSAIALVVIIVGIIGCKTIISSHGKKQYAKDYQTLVNLMFDGAADAEAAGSLIHDVWSNTIYEKYSSTTDKYTLDSDGRFYDDFNTSLMMLMLSDEFISDKNDIKQNQEQVQKLMKEMKNPPEEYADAYDALKDFYEAYTKLVGYATDPTGNLSTYTEGFNNADTDTLNTYKATLLYVED